MMGNACANIPSSVAFLCAVSFLSSCAGEKRDSLGQPMTLSQPKALTADQTDLNVGIFLDPRTMTNIERTIRDNRGINEKIELVDANNLRIGNVHTQRVQNGFFSRYTINDLEDPGQFRAWVEKALQKYQVVHQTEPEKVSNPNSRMTVGYKTRVTIAQGNVTCFAAQVGYRFEKITIYDNDENHPDTIVQVMSCTRAQRYDDLDQLMSGVGIMATADALTINKKLATNSASSPTLSAQSKPATPKSMTNPLTVEWEGFPNPIAGVVEVETPGGSGKIRLTLPNNEGSCSGSYSAPVNRVRSWAIACTNGVSASGTSESPPSGPIAIGRGTDSRGRSLRFSVGS